MNPARPDPGVKLCALDEIEDPGAKGFDFRTDTRMFLGFVVRRGDEAVGYIDSCPHIGWPLASLNGRYLTRDGAYILCSGHGAVFEIADGLCIGGPCGGRRLDPWPVEVRDGQVWTA